MYIAEQSCTMWDSLCRAKGLTGRSLLEDGSSNVQVPSLEDIAASLPATWIGSVRQTGCSEIACPDKAWLDLFWLTASAHEWKTVAELFSDFLLVPLHGGRIASAAYCKAHTALTATALSYALSRDQGAIQVLSGLGCVCISHFGADMVSPLPADKEPISQAIAAAAKQNNLTVQQFISEQHLGTDTFQSVCNVLSNISVKGHLQLGSKAKQQLLQEEHSSAAAPALLAAVHCV